MAVATVRLTNGKHVKLGRNQPKSRPYALSFANYYNAAADTTPPPAVVDYSKKAAAAIAHMYLNDTYGDCVIAGKYHQVGIWSGNELGTPVIGTDNEVYSAYQTICGPGDNGCDISTVLNYFRDHGLKFNGQTHKIDGYVSVDWTNKLEVQVALDLFGSLTLGINLPSDWTSVDHNWDVTSSSVVGGHDVCCVGYSETGVQICTWGAMTTITWAAFNSTQWLSECYAELAPDWYNKDNLAPNGVNVQSLKDDLAKLGNGNIPPLDPTPPVPPVPPGPPKPPPGPPVPPPVPGGTFTITLPAVTIPGQKVNGTGIFGTSVTVTTESYTIPSQVVTGTINHSMEFAFLGIPWDKIFAEIVALVKQYGPDAAIYIEAYIATLNLPSWATTMIDAVINALIQAITGK